MKNEAIYTQYMYSYPHKTAYRKLNGIVFDDYKHYLQAGKNGLYFHVPFCESKCGYCNLFSVTGKNSAYMDSYLDAMEEQIRQYQLGQIEFCDLTIGGGTPLLLSEAQLERLFVMAEHAVRWEKKEHPVIIETSPNQTTEEKLAILKEHGVSRVSIGVQSFCEEELRQLNRRHTVCRAREAIELIKSKEFACMNLDLIYGIPGQTIDSVMCSVKEALLYEPEELFVYPLYIKEGTYLAGKQVKNPESTFAMYQEIRRFLQENGYVAYSMRRFVRKDCENHADMQSCGFGNTVSIGCGGRSYMGNLHFCTPYSVSQPACREVLADYISTKDYTHITNGYILNEEEEKRRYVIKNLLFASGISKKEYKELFGKEPEEDWVQFTDWKNKKYLYEEDNHFYLTEEGFSLSDYLGPMLISEEVQNRMKEWKEGLC